MTQKALVRACSAWAIRVSKAQICCSGRRERDIVDRPLLFKLHQSYRLLPCFIREFNPASQEIWSGPAECRQLPPANTLQNKCGDDGDDLNTAVGISLQRWCGNAVIVTALGYRLRGGRGAGLLRVDFPFRAYVNRLEQPHCLRNTRVSGAVQHNWSGFFSAAVTQQTRSTSASQAVCPRRKASVENGRCKRHADEF